MRGSVLMNKLYVNPAVPVFRTIHLEKKKKMLLIGNNYYSIVPLHYYYGNNYYSIVPLHYYYGDRVK